MKLKHASIGILFCLMAGTAMAADTNSLNLIPWPQSVTPGDGAFKLTPDTLIHTDSDSSETANFLAARLRLCTGYPLHIVSLETKESKANILLTTQNAKSNLGPEGYELTVMPDRIVIRAPAQAGLFYGVQTLFQLLPPQIFSTQMVANVDWQIPAVHIEDQPRFPWRGLMLDVSRHFFTAQEIEQLLDTMATLKMNTFHWHLTDDHGWRIQIEKYPDLTKIGAWRDGIGFGLDPKDSTAYGLDGRYGGFYTPEDIQEVVNYASARHITIVPEIEMPGHSLAALEAYPEYSCTGGPFTIPDKLGIFNGIYDPANPDTYKFLDDILTEVFQLFPGKYIHIGGDEVPKDTWKASADCQALMKQDGLTNENQLQGLFMQRMEKFVASQGRIPIGWSEIQEGGLATNTVVMDWIGGAAEAASSGHDAVMTFHRYCYLCYYPSQDRPPNLIAYRPYLPLSKVYSYEPIPTNLAAQYDSHILGVEASVWTPNIPSMSDVEQLTFPRADALAEVGWSPKSSRDFDDFSRRLAVGMQRLAISGINYWKDDATQIGSWKPAELADQDNLLNYDVTQKITAPGRYRVSFDYTEGNNGLNIKWVALLEDGKEITSDTHTGFTGTSKVYAHDWNYYFDLPACKSGAQYTLQASVGGDGGNDSKGVVFLGAEAAAKN